MVDNKLYLHHFVNNVRQNIPLQNIIYTWYIHTCIYKDQSQILSYYPIQLSFILFIYIISRKPFTVRFILVFYMFLIEVKYRVLKKVNLILIIWRVGEAASDRMYKHRQVCWEIMTRHHCYWHLTAWTKQGIVSHFNIYMIRTWSKSSKYATLMKRSKNN